MLNALRLAGSAPLAAFSERTGLPLPVIQPRLDELGERALQEVRDGKLRCTATAWRFLDTVAGEFF
ncbi:MAG: hypothetical protein ACK5HY_04590 [Parahaliea sp.]